ncbi:MAG: tetratricopeptide repeat protein [Pseudomonadota bacterium]
MHRVILTLVLCFWASGDAAADCSDAWLDRVLVANNEKRFGDTAEIAMECIDSDSPGNELAGAYILRGRALVILNRYEEGVADIRKAIAIDEGVCWGHLVLLSVRWQRRERPLETAGLQRCLAGDPLNQDAINALALAHHASGEYIESARAYGALYLLTGNQQDRVSEGWTLALGGELDRGEAIVREAIASDPADWRAYESLAQVLRRGESNESAMEALETAQKLLPEDDEMRSVFLADIADTRARILVAMNQPDRAREEAQRSLSIHELGGPHLVLAQLDMGAGAMDKACEHVDKAVEIGVGYTLLDDLESLVARCDKHGDSAL